MHALIPYRIVYGNHTSFLKNFLFSSFKNTDLTNTFYRMLSIDTLTCTKNNKGQLQKIIDNYPVVVFSKTTCPYCSKVKELFKSINVEATFIELNQEYVSRNVHSLLIEMTGQKTVPNIFINGQHIGGCDRIHEIHSKIELIPLLEKAFKNHRSFDYDLIVIGGGSGGLACSKEFASYGKKTAVCDFVVPSPQNTKWGLGGTCVNVGCIPKKLMHQSSIIGESLHDSHAFGWSTDLSNIKHDWSIMAANIHSYIKGLNFSYKSSLKESKVDYLNSFATLVDKNTVRLNNGKTEKTLTSKYIVISTGERPKQLECEGSELCHTSDDLFWFNHSPGKTLVVGASYVALECAGFLNGIGLEAKVMMRSIPLRGFDQDMAMRVKKFMEETRKIPFINSVPNKIVCKKPGNRNEGVLPELKVFYTKDGAEQSEIFNTILVAIGRSACTKSVNLHEVGVTLDKNFYVKSDTEQTNVSNIFAVGDILAEKPKLTPLAIQAGRLLARRILGLTDVETDYTNVPTTVFTPVEYGCCGLSEEDADRIYGKENIEVYQNYFTPLEYALTRKVEPPLFSKLICKKDDEKVIGFHITGPNAGEITQGFAVAMKVGAKKSHFDATIGIHPTVAECFIDMRYKRSTGGAFPPKGC